MEEKVAKAGTAECPEWVESSHYANGSFGWKADIPAAQRVVAGFAEQKPNPVIAASGTATCPDGRSEDDVDYNSL